MNSQESQSKQSGSTAPVAAADLWGRARNLLTLQRQAVSNSIVKIQPKGDRPPLFLVHGVGGGMLWGYNNLARELGDHQPIYAFKSRGMDGLEEFTRIEDMAAQYVAELRKFQPEGPYCLGGYCFGGNVAFEMARQLTEQKQEVALLLMINCWANNSSYTRLSWTPAFFVRFFWNLAWRLKYQIWQGAKRPRDYFKWRTAWVGKKIKALLSRKMEDRVAVEDIVDLSPQPEHERKLWRTHVQAFLQYQPRPYDGHIVLLRTRGHPLVCSFDPEMGWGAFASGGVTVKICRGDHESILEDRNVAWTARQLRDVLEDLQRPIGVVTKISPGETRELLQVAAKNGYAPGACNIRLTNLPPSA